MSKNRNTVPIVPEQAHPISKEQRAQLFNAEYVALCKKHGLQLGFAPQWKQSSDTGTYSMVIQIMLTDYLPQG